VVALGEVRPVLVLEHLEPVQAVLEELRKRRAGERPDLRVWVQLQDGAQELLVA
jgi:hypothetical protein